MYCSKCGNAMADGSPYCPRCGQPSPASATPQFPLAPQAIPAAAPGLVSPHWRPAPTIPYAGFWLRVVAYLVDSLIMGFVIMAILVPLFFLSGGVEMIRGLHPGEEPDPHFFLMIFAFYGILVGAALLGGWLYYAYFESSSWQATPGKKILNLFVTDLNGRPVSFGRASGRFFAKLITGLIPLGIGYALAGFTEKKQALHDMIASCLVMRRY
ncbi:MAG TPA: RDD family protein [Terriglobales bacterium]|nr:RDD family protein [Terriglobales bacterium]